MDLDSMLSGLDQDQRRAVESPASPLAVIAPAGSGKTRVLTARMARRIAIGEADAAHTLCVTFTRRAADELDARLRSSGVRDRIETGTFHAVAWRQLRDRWQAQGRSAPTLLDRIRPFLKDQLQVTSPTDLVELSNELGWARARLLVPDQYPGEARAAGRRTRRDSTWIAEQMGAYATAKARRHVVDFDDILAACASAIEGDDGFAAAQRWRFRHLYVDEFQDVNPLQFRLLEAWRGGRWDVFVVGDPYQSIYGWNGAEPRLLEQLSAHWPPLETINLDRTHRSTPQVTAAAASVIESAGLPDRHPISSGPDGPAVRCFAHADEVAEIEAIATAIRRRREPGLTWRDFAVLARTQEQVIDLDRGLAALGVPTAIRRQAPVLESPTVRRVLARLRHDDRPVLVGLGECEAASIDEPEMEVLLGAAETARTDGAPMTGATFVAWAYANLGDVESQHRRDAVTVSTMHAAKGLEWTVVHVAGCEDGHLPIASARRREARDEEARLLYVAVTRARGECTLHWAQSRSIRGVRRQRERSPFLARIDDSAPRSPRSTGSSPNPGSVDLLLGRARSGLPVAATADDPLLDELRRWRDDRARAARSVPASIVDDEGLAAIVRVRPVDLEALAVVAGLGPARLHRFGAELLALVIGAASGAASSSPEPESADLRLP